MAVNSANKAAGAAVDVATQQLQKQGASILKRFSGSRRNANVPEAPLPKKNKVDKVKENKVKEKDGDEVDLSAI